MRIEINIMIGGTRNVVIFMTHNNQDYEDYNQIKRNEDEIEIMRIKTR